MAKRFTDTDKWRKEWFQDLPPRLKCFWQFLCDNCDHAGVWDQNYRLASFQVGETVTADDLVAFGDRVQSLENGKLWIVGFIEYQYGSLSDGCKAHVPVFKSIEKNGLNERVSKGYPKGIQTLKDKDKDKDKEKDKEKDSTKPPKPPKDYTPEFETFWQRCPRKTGKGQAFDAFKKAVAEIGSDDAWKLITAAMVKFARLEWPEDRPIEDLPYCPHPATWLNQRRWEDEPTQWKPRTNGKHEPQPPAYKDLAELD